MTITAALLKQTAQHTPGPWFTDIDNTSGQVGRVRASHKGGRDNVCVAEVPSAKDSAEREANAHLIAAAPDLYAALADLLSAYAEPDKQICCNGQHCGCQGSTVQQMAEHYARAAIAKATGGAA